MRNFDSFGLAAETALISAAIIPHCGVERKKAETRESFACLMNYQEFSLPLVSSLNELGRKTLEREVEKSGW